MSETKDIAALYREALSEYGSDSGDDDMMRDYKHVILHLLPVPDRIMIILYAELRSYRKIGQLMGLSHNTVRKEVLRIRKEINERYEHIHRYSAADPDGGLHR